MSGGQRRGKAPRSRKLTPEERKAAEANGAQARRAKARPTRESLTKAIFGSTGRTLRIGGLASG